MGKLIISDLDGTISERVLDQERISIGRSPDNDLAFPDKAVSSKHAAIIQVGEESFLEDLGSTNGTQVNGKTIKRHALVNGDVIYIGRNTLRYFGFQLPADDDATVVLKHGSSGSAGAKLTRAGKPTQGKLQVLRGANAGTELALNKPLLTFGKPGVQVAAVTRREEGYYLAQVGSAAPKQQIVLNGAPIGTQILKLSDGDIIGMMGTQLKFIAVD